MKGPLKSSQDSADLGDCFGNGIGTDKSKEGGAFLKVGAQDYREDGLLRGGGQDSF